MDEVWKWIPGYEESYKVSSHGRLKTYINRPEGKIMRANPNRGGYTRVGLRIPGTPARTYKYIDLHRLVAMVFVSGYDKDLQVDHIDGDRSNNNHSNLRWVDSLVNSSNRSSYSIVRRRVTDIEVDNILTDYRTGCYTQRQLGGKYNRAERTINRICNGMRGR